jgi:hypothetical protein
MFITVLSDGDTWDVGGSLVEVSEEEYNRLIASGDLDELVSSRDINLNDIVIDDGEDLFYIRTEDLDPVLKSHRRELVKRLSVSIKAGNVSDALRIAKCLV